MQQELREIQALMRQKKVEQARARLTVFLQQYPNSAAGWYLLSYAAATAPEKRQAAQKAAALAPQNKRYAARLAALASGRRVPWAGLGALLVAIILVIAAALAFGPQLITSDDGTLPTRVVLPQSEQNAVASAASETPTATHTPTVTETVETPEPTATVTETLTFTPESTVTPDGPTPTPPQGTSESTDEPVADAPDEAVTSSAPSIPPAMPDFNAPPDQPTPIIVQAPTLSPSATLPPTATDTPAPTNTPGIAPTATDGPSATPEISVEDAVALFERGTLAGGTMRLLEVARPGSAVMRDLGYTPPSPPAGTQWMLLEALMICNGGSDCTPDDVRVLAASGTRYTPESLTGISPYFHQDGFTTGQVWGFLIFAVPRSETRLWLEVSDGGAVTHFALQ